MKHWKRISRLAIGGTCALMTVGCTTRSDLDTLNSNEMTLREMIASDRQQIAALDQSNKQLQDQIDQLKHAGAGTEGGPAKSAAYDDRLTKLEASVSALQVTTPGGAANPPAAGAPASAAGNGSADAGASAASQRFKKRLTAPPRA
jgi:hypothetical protein